MLSTVFIFAHQDDEFGVYPVIETAVRNSERVVCLYLTNGVHTGQSSARRNAESLSVLSKLGVAVGDVHFVGEAVTIPGGALHEHLHSALESAAGVVSSLGEISALYILAWEGGHQDHDAAHLIGLALARRLGILDRTRQFSLYHGAGLPWVFFKVLAPLEANGNICRISVPLRDRLRYLKFCLSYRSQARTWVGLFPFVLVAFLFGTQKLQPVDISRVHQTPHGGRLLYERRGFLSYRKFLAKVGPFVAVNFG